MSNIVIPEEWKGRLESLVGNRRDLLTVVAVLVGVVAIVLVLRFRSPPALIAPPSTETLAPSEASTDASTAVAPGTTPAPTSELYVHVAGAVRDPGLYRLPDGSRVADALKAAGGHSTRADLDAINLAELLVDGAKIDVPRKGGAQTPAPVAASSPSGTTAAPGTTGTSIPATAIDLNTADSVALETIPGIGPVRAAAIVQHRDENGPFPSVDALIDVSGIGPVTLESVRPYVRV